MAFLYSQVYLKTETEDKSQEHDHPHGILLTFLVREMIIEEVLTCVVLGEAEDLSVLYPLVIFMKISYWKCCFCLSR